MIFTLKISGAAGQGIKSAGLMFSKLAVRSGYNIYNYTEYPSLIRGGHNVMQTTVCDKEITGPLQNIDMLVVLDNSSIEKDAGRLNSGSSILFDPDSVKISSDKDYDLFSLPLSKLAKNLGGDDLLINTVALGAVTALLAGDLSILLELINEEFHNKEEKLINLNLSAAKTGYDFATNNFSKIKIILKPNRQTGQKIIINGNDAVALGAISAGLQFAAIYPMSPASGILHTLALHQEKYGYIYKEPEDEISAINMAIGAGFAGARSLTATSGGGFCLMTEGYGLAGMTETPLVIVNAMRGGPATGLPTWSEQGDLQFVLNAHQGNFPKIVLAAGDTKEAFELTIKAFNLADKYQTPVVLLIDKNICDHEQSFPVFDSSQFVFYRHKFTTEKRSDFQRYEICNDGISFRSTPGTGNYFLANSDEHDENGFSTEDCEMRNRQMEKRMKKMETCAVEDLEKPVLYGPENAKLTIVSWGSNKGSILEALKQFPDVNYLHLTWFSPFPSEAVKRHLESAQKILGIEANFSGQMCSVIREKTGIEIDNKFLKYDGRPFFVEEIIDYIKNLH